MGPKSDQRSTSVFTRNGGVWALQASLLPTNGALDEGFGDYVGISGDTVVVGAIFDNVGGNTRQGSAYVFTRSGGVWTQQAKLLATDGAPSDNFGANVAISGNTVVVGTNGDDVGANSNQGSAYVFTRSGNFWNRTRI